MITNSSISFLSVPDQFLPLSIFYLNFLATLKPQNISTTVAAKHIINKYYIGAKNAVIIDPIPTNQLPIILPFVILLIAVLMCYSVCDRCLIIECKRYISKFSRVNLLERKSSNTTACRNISKVYVQSRRCSGRCYCYRSIFG